jgi:hypothetical protein
MRMIVVAVPALAGSLLLAPFLPVPSAQAGGVPNLNNAVSATHAGAITHVYGGGGGGGGHGGGWGSGHMGGGHWG